MPDPDGTAYYEDVTYQVDETKAEEMTDRTSTALAEDLFHSSIDNEAVQTITLTEADWKVIYGGVQLQLIIAAAMVEQGKDDLFTYFMAMANYDTACKYAKEFQDLIFGASEPRITNGEVQDDRVVAITGPFNTLFAAASTVIRPRVEVDYVTPESLADPDVQRVVDTVKNSWTNIKAQFEPLAPGFGKDLD